MPKLKKKVLTATLYAYVKPVNKKYVLKTAKKAGISYSAFLNSLIETYRQFEHVQTK